jgi:hypothetical protein
MEKNTVMSWLLAVFCGVFPKTFPLWKKINVLIYTVEKARQATGVHLRRAFSAVLRAHSRIYSM